jgi:hypothetical protein
MSLIISLILVTFGLISGPTLGQIIFSVQIRIQWPQISKKQYTWNFSFQGKIKSSQVPWWFVGHMKVQKKFVSKLIYLDYQSYVKFHCKTFHAYFYVSKVDLKLSQKKT